MYTILVYTHYGSSVVPSIRSPSSGRRNGARSRAGTVQQLQRDMRRCRPQSAQEHGAPFPRFSASFCTVWGQRGRKLVESRAPSGRPAWWMRVGQAAGGKKVGGGRLRREAAELPGSVTVRHGPGELFASKPPRRADRIGPVVCGHGGGSRKAKRNASKKFEGAFEYGLVSKEPVLSRGAPRLSVKQRREVVAQLERTGQGCSIMRIGGYRHAALCIANGSDE